MSFLQIKFIYQHETSKRINFALIERVEAEWEQERGLELDREPFEHGLCQGLYSKYLSTGMSGTQTPHKRKAFQQRALEIPFMTGFTLLVAGSWGEDGMDLRC